MKTRAVHEHTSHFHFEIEAFQEEKALYPLMRHDVLFVDTQHVLGFPYWLFVVGTHTSQSPADLHHNCVHTKTSFLYEKEAWHLLILIEYFAKGNTVVKVRSAKYLSLPEPGDLLICTMGGWHVVYPKLLSGRHGINEGVAHNEHSAHSSTSTQMSSQRTQARRG